MPFDNTRAAELDLILHAAADLIERDGWCQRAARASSCPCTLSPSYGRSLRSCCWRARGWRLQLQRSDKVLS